MIPQHAHLRLDDLQSDDQVTNMCHICHWHGNERQHLDRGTSVVQRTQVWEFVEMTCYFREENRLWERFKAQYICFEAELWINWETPVGKATHCIYEEGAWTPQSVLFLNSKSGNVKMWEPVLNKMQSRVQVLYTRPLASRSALFSLKCRVWSIVTCLRTPNQSAHMPTWGCA